MLKCVKNCSLCVQDDCAMRNRMNCVLQLLTEKQKKNQLGAVQVFLIHYEDQGDNFLDSTMTGVETWVVC